MPRTLDYPYIRAWHYTSGSFSFYVDALVTRARATGAPPDALYERRSPDGTPEGWRTVRDLDGSFRDENIRAMHVWMDQHGVVIPEPVT